MIEKYNEEINKNQNEKGCFKLRCSLLDVKKIIAKFYHYDEPKSPQIIEHPDNLNPSQKTPNMLDIQIISI
jgi:hypothetical protein